MFDPKKYWENRLATNYDLIGVGDISCGQYYNKWSYSVTRKILKRLFKKYVNSTTNSTAVLDVGPGTGFVVEIWESLGNKVAGVDISATAVKKLSAKFPSGTFMEFDIGSGELPMDDNHFDCVSAASVLYHIVDDGAFSQALENIYRVLKPGGYFIFSDNFIHDRVYNITHQKCRTLSEYETALKSKGFDIVDRVPNYVLMNDPVDANTKFYPRIWSLLTRLSKKSKVLDAIIWPVLYPVELFLTANMKESPAQEFMICRARK